MQGQRQHEDSIQAHTPAPQLDLKELGATTIAHRSADTADQGGIGDNNPPPPPPPTPATAIALAVAHAAQVMPAPTRLSYEAIVVVRAAVGDCLMDQVRRLKEDEEKRERLKDLLAALG